MSHLIVIAATASFAAASVIAAQAPGTAEARKAVGAFTAQVEREWPGARQQQAITVRSLILLADAVHSLAAARQLLTPELLTVLDRLKTETQRFQSGTPDDAAEHTLRLQHALLTATDLLGRVAGPDSDNEAGRARLAALRRAADGIDRRQPLQRQPDVMERYFHQAAELLNHLAPR